MPRASEESAATPRKKLLSPAWVKLRLALGSVLVLITGALMAPRAARTALSPPQERAAPLLEEQVQRREAPVSFRGVQAVAAGVSEHIVTIPTMALPVVVLNDFGERPRQPLAAGFGVFVSERYVLTHAGALGGRTSVSVQISDGTALPAEVAAYEPPTGLVLLHTAPSAKRSASQASESPAAGALVVAVGRSEGVDLAVPVFVTRVEADRLRINETGNSVPPGMPLFTLNGELLAIANGDERTGAAFPVAQAAARLIERASTGERPSSFGIAVQNLIGPLTQAFGDKGVLVSDVIVGGPADLAGVAVGDVILAAGESELDSAETAARVLSESPVGGTMSLRVVQNGRTRVIEATAATTYDVAALARQRISDPAAGVEASGLFSQRTLENAGIPPTARVVRMNGRLVSSRGQGERELRTSRRSVTVLLRHQGRQFFAAIDPTR